EEKVAAPLRAHHVEPHCGEPRRYLTSFNKTGERGRPCGLEYFAFSVSTSRSTASHKAFNSESSIRLSLIRSSRMATDTSCAVSRSPPRTRVDWHSSRVARISTSLSSELFTSVF